MGKRERPKREKTEDVQEALTRIEKQRDGSDAALRRGKLVDTMMRLILVAETGGVTTAIVAQFREISELYAEILLEGA